MKLVDVLLRSLPWEPLEGQVFWTNGKDLLSQKKEATIVLNELLAAVADGEFEKTEAYGEEENVRKLFNGLLSQLPKMPTESLNVWTNGEEILAATDVLANDIADLLDTIAGGQFAVTGYYDRKEDERDGMVNSVTGYHYVSV